MAQGVPNWVQRFGRSNGTPDPDRYAEPPPPEDPVYAEQPVSPSVTEGQGSICADAQRTVSAGGKFAEVLLHPTFVPFEQVYRKTAPEGIYTATPTQPFSFEIGAFTVPQQRNLIVAEYSFQIFRFDGQAAGSVVPLERERLTTAIGYDVNFSQFRKGNLQYEIFPTPPPSQPNAFFGNIAPASSFPGSNRFRRVAGMLNTVYNQSQASTAAKQNPNIFNKVRSFVLGQRAGSALLPQTQQRQGPQSFPFSYIVASSQTVQLRVTAFGAQPVPVAFFQARIAGFEVPANTLTALLDGVRPCQ